MSAVRLQLSNLPARTSEAQIQQAFGPLGHVLSVRLSGGTCLVEIESATVVEAIDSAGLGEIRLGDIRQVDSAGIGELRNATVRLA